MKYSKQRQVNETISTTGRGVSDTMSITKNAAIQNLAVRVMLTHHNTSEVSIRLQSPKGSTISLFGGEKLSGKQHTLVFDGDALSRFTKLKSKGDWTLKVSDKSGRKAGMLNNWSIDMDLKDSRRSEIFIPDNTKESLSSSHFCGEAGKITALSVYVNIAHKYIGDLKVVLEAPSGKRRTLHNRDGGNKKNLVKTYKGDDLKTLIGEEAHGEWTLHLDDKMPQDSGRIKKWTMKMETE